jgi:uncharacterized phosphosugar-binding protein
MTWITEARAVLDRLENEQRDNIEAASQIAADSIGAGGVMHAFGTGHSRIPVEELFPRYGSYPGFHPMVELSMTYHTEVVGSNGQRQAMFIERVEGFADTILANFALRPVDSMLVFSASGLNAVPIEIAMGARKNGLKVVAVTSLAESLGGAPRHSSGTRLCDHADVVIDLCTPIGDAMCTVDGLDVPVGPGSTLAAVAIANSIKVRTAALLTARGAMPAVLTSSQLVGADRSNRLFEDAYLDHAERSAAVLRQRR